MFHVELRCAPRLPHVAVLALTSIGFAGCSADMSTRLSQDSFFNPFASQPEATASAPSAASFRNMPARNRWANPRPLRTQHRNLIRPRAPVPQEGRSGNFLCSAHQPFETTGSAAPL